jgi:drug/metabolite transporter superfamily protein YnfA
MVQGQEEQPDHMFSPWARFVLAAFCLLFGLMLLLWASDQREIWKFAPALFCLAVFSALISSRRASRLFGRVVAFAVLSTIVFVLIDGHKEFSITYIAQAVGIVTIFGIPAFMFLVRGQMPFNFQGTQPSVSVEFDDHEIHCTWPKDGTRSIAWGELNTVTLITTDEGPSAEDVYWHLSGVGTTEVVVPQGAAGHQDFLAEMQRRLPGFNNEAVIQAMGSTSNARFPVWSRSNAPGIVVNAADHP